MYAIILVVLFSICCSIVYILNSRKPPIVVASPSLVISPSQIALTPINNPDHTPSPSIQPKPSMSIVEIEKIKEVMLNNVDAAKSSSHYAQISFNHAMSVLQRIRLPEQTTNDYNAVISQAVMSANRNANAASNSYESLKNLITQDSDVYNTYFYGFIIEYHKSQAVIDSARAAWVEGLIITEEAQIMNISPLFTQRTLNAAKDALNASKAAEVVMDEVNVAMIAKEPEINLTMLFNKLRSLIQATWITRRDAQIASHETAKVILGDNYKWNVFFN